MSTAELLEQLKQLSDVERLERHRSGHPVDPQRPHSRHGGCEAGPGSALCTVAAGVKELYEPGSELTRWTALDAEEFADEHLASSRVQSHAV